VAITLIPVCNRKLRTMRRIPTPGGCHRILRIDPCPTFLVWRGAPEYALSKRCGIDCGRVSNVAHSRLPAVLGWRPRDLWKEAVLVSENPPEPRTFDPEDMRLRGRLGAFATLSRHDPKILTAAARQQFLKRFLDEVDPRAELPAEERERRAHFARKRYFASLALESARARRKSEPADVP
jgi:hypothetical protein